MSSNTRSKFIKIRVTPDEIVEIKKRAGDTDMSTYIRQLALDQPIAPPARKQKKIVHSVDPEFIREVNRIGNNVNQIAKYLNEGNELSNAILIALLNLQTSLDETVQRVMPNDS